MNLHNNLLQYFMYTSYNQGSIRHSTQCNEIK